MVILVWINISRVNSSTCNEFDEYHNFAYPTGHSISHVYGQYSSRREDRMYCYGCQSTNPISIPKCYQTNYINLWDSPVAILCHPNHYIAGVRSFHDNHREDRRFDFKCCTNSGQCTRNCYLEGPVNEWNGNMATWTSKFMLVK